MEVITENRSPSYHESTKRAIRERRKDHQQRTSRPGSVRVVSALPLSSATEQPVIVTTTNVQNHPSPAPATDNNLRPLPMAPTENRALEQTQDQLRLPSRSYTTPAESSPPPAHLTIPMAPVIPSIVIGPQPSQENSPMSTATTRVSSYAAPTSFPQSEPRHQMSQEEAHYSAPIPPRTFHRPYRSSTSPATAFQPGQHSHRGSKPVQHFHLPTISRKPVQYSHGSTSGEPPARVPYDADDFGISERFVPPPLTQAHYTTTSRNSDLVELAESQGYPPSSSDYVIPDYPPTTTNNSHPNTTNTQRSFPGHRHPINIRWHPNRPPPRDTAATTTTYGPEAPPPAPFNHISKDTLSPTSSSASRPPSYKYDSPPPLPPPPPPVPPSSSAHTVDRQADLLAIRPRRPFRQSHPGGQYPAVPPPYSGPSSSYSGPPYPVGLNERFGRRSHG